MRERLCFVGFDVREEVEESGKTVRKMTENTINNSNYSL